MKYCITCQLYRPPGCANAGSRPLGAHQRTGHCNICDTCIEQFDHHCPFLSNCIGRNNYRSFFLLLHMALANITLLIYCNTSLQLKYSTDMIDIYQIMMKYLMTAILGLIALPLIVLAGYHWIKVATQGATTYEAIKQSQKGYLVDPRNPRQHYLSWCAPICLAKLFRKLELTRCLQLLTCKSYPFDADRRLFRPTDVEGSTGLKQGDEKK